MGGGGGGNWAAAASSSPSVMPDSLDASNISSTSKGPWAACSLISEGMAMSPSLTSNKVLEGKAHRVALTANPHCLEHARVLKLLEDEVVDEEIGDLLVVWLDAADKVRLGLSQQCHQLFKQSLLEQVGQLLCLLVCNELFLLFEGES